LTEWDGRGLPPVARARVDRYAASGLKTSLLSVPAAVGIETVGLSPVGEVMGCIVMQIYPAIALGTATMMATNTGLTMEPFAAAMRHGYNMALDRLRQEAVAIGADGVVGVTFSISHLGNGQREFVALGTAVRAETKQRPKRLFTTELAGQDVAKLMLAGWAPASLMIALEARATYNYNAAYQLTAWAGNVEVDAYTQLVSKVRAGARGQFRRTLKQTGADGAIVSAMSLNMWPLGESAVAAQAVMFGTAIAKFHRGKAAPHSTLTILPVRQR
jgi:uncharacterized protein YbjQ (UPF0145 family)